MKWKLVLAGLAVAVGAGLTVMAHAQGSPEALVKQRQAKMTLQVKYLGQLVAMAQGKVPFNAEIAARDARYLHTLEEMAWDGFDASTKGMQSRALPAIWEEPDKFKAAQQNLYSAVDALVAATKTGDEAKIKAAVPAVGKACGACHDHFREKR